MTSKVSLDKWKTWGYILMFKKQNQWDYPIYFLSNVPIWEYFSLELGNLEDQIIKMF